MRRAISKNDVPIRLTEERWFHIIEHHDDLAGYVDKVLETIEAPEIVYEGWGNELLAVKEMQKGKYIIVAYREVSKRDGFVITSFFTTKIEKLKWRRIIWQK